MKKRSQKFTEIPLDVVGSTAFGRYPKISLEQTYNMIISDGWLVPYAGYKNVKSIAPFAPGRGLFSSVKGNFMLMVVGNDIYKITPGLQQTYVNSISTYTGNVFIDENEKGEIAICDLMNIYIYNYNTGTFKLAKTGTGNLDFTPGYVCFQDGRFISVDQKSPQWCLGDLVDSTQFPVGTSFRGTFQTKPDLPQAAVRFPGRGNLLMIFGKTVTEMWYDLGAFPFPYQRNSSVNIDFGCLNPATIASNETMIVWLAANEKSGPTIVYTSGADIQRISNDGIDFKFSQLTDPTDAYGFLFKQDGHLIYQITFPTDNLSLAYDFNTGKFFTLCDKNMDRHIAKRVVFFNGNYYFISLIDGNLYELSTQFTDGDGFPIPRIRVCKNIRLPDASRFIVNNLTFTLEQGESASVQYADFSFSKNGGESFSNIDRKQLNTLGNRENRLIYWVRTQANDFVPQFRFWSSGRFVLNNGVVNIYE